MMKKAGKRWERAEPVSWWEDANTHGTAQRKSAQEAGPLCSRCLRTGRLLDGTSQAYAFPRRLPTPLKGGPLQ